MKKIAIYTKLPDSGEASGKSTRSKETFVTAASMSASAVKLVRAGETLLLAAVLAVYACVLPLYAERFTDDDAVTVTASQSAEMLIRYEAQSRDDLRDDAVAALLALAVDPNATEAQRERAQEQMEKRLLFAEQEAAIEEELAARGIEGCVVNLATGYCGVIVAYPPSSSESARIYEAVERVSGLVGGDIRILPLNIP